MRLVNTKSVNSTYAGKRILPKIWCGVPAAYLHIANNARTKTKDFETGYLKNLKNWKQDILNYYNAIDKACKNLQMIRSFTRNYKKQ